MARGLTPCWALGVGAALASHVRIMPRPPRQTPGGFVYHVYNRGSRKGCIFASSRDFDAFEELMAVAREKFQMRIIAYCLMRTHIHFLLWPRGDDDTPRFMQSVTGQHARLWHWVTGTTGTGAVYQSRYGCVPIEDARHYFTAMRYIERNPLAAGYVDIIDAWPWSSIWQGNESRPPFELDEGPYPRPSNWFTHLESA